MDPPHITEFASERYFSKLNQLHDPAGTSAPVQQSSSRTQVHHAPPDGSSHSTFILPLRTHKTTDDNLHTKARPEKEKSRLRGLRSKVSFLHSKSTHAPEEVDLPRTSFTEPAKQYGQRFDQLFLALPNELQVQVIAALPLHDVLKLRLVSKTWHTLVCLNEGPIVRYHLDHHIPAYALRLYPVSDLSMVNFHHLCSLWHRLHVATKLSFLMCEWITKEIFLRTTEAQRAEFAPQYERMRRRLIPLLFTIFHFFETYRKLHLQHISEHGGQGLSRQPYTLNPVEMQIMSTYDDQTLLRVHQVFPLVVSSFCRQLRPPTYVGRVERSLRGYLREKPSDEIHTAILLLGGLRQVERLWEIKGYNNRRGAVDTWYNELTREPPPEAPTKTRRGLMGLGRKKSASGTKETPSIDAKAAGSRRGSGDSLDDGLLTSRHLSSIFNTSLSAGMPMDMLSVDDVRHILPDLPGLQQIWSATAEALILDRGIVERPQDIKRNAQVMLDLIKDDGIDEEDEWWYGKGTPDSVRPPLGSIEEGAVEGV
ncbi:F-box domain-containing protein [Plectosphaerella cucumerina]|uniref:F-box domain-containing protein n=1 Tax=Plectosphaerella cucumerina TaxID=40658 RepID=A0A8K0TIC7_9PEZI|nr:F-box domain-containing protein [Plectosphaerella cucumerina]